MKYNQITVAILLLIVSGASQIAAANTEIHTNACAYDRDRMLSLDQNSFDQDFTGGWRAVAKKEGCKVVAADLIREYIETYKTNSTILIFHEAQMRAMAGQTEAAIRLFAKTYRPPGKPDRIGWNHYVDATIAFLEQDAAALAEARSNLLVVEEPEGYNPVDIGGRPMRLIWPPNLNVVDGFIECFSRTYNQAFGECSRPLVQEEPGKMQEQ